MKDKPAKEYRRQEFYRLPYKQQIGLPGRDPSPSWANQTLILIRIRKKDESETWEEGSVVLQAIDRPLSKKTVFAPISQHSSLSSTKDEPRDSLLSGIATFIWKIRSRLGFRNTCAKDNSKSFQRRLPVCLPRNHPLFQKELTACPCQQPQCPSTHLEEQTTPPVPLAHYSV